MRKIILLLSSLLILAAMSTAQRNYELACPAGYSDMEGPTYNPSTQMFRSWLCVNSLGFVTSPVFSAGTTPFSNITSGLNIIPALMQVGNGSRLIPNTVGQISNNSTWLIETDPAPSTGPTWIGNAAGGTLTSSNVYGVEITLNSAAGETTPSAEIQHTLPACPGDVCSATVTAPTIPSIYTGYTVYARKVSGGPQPMQQIAGCVNIVANCTITAIPATSGPPTVNSVMPFPSGAGASACPPNVTPYWWIQDLNGVPQSQAYISNTQANVWNGGIIVECRPHWWNDAGGTLGSWGDPPGGNNAMIVMDHLAGRGTSTTNQDRTLWVGYQNSHTDAGTHYGMEAIQAELDLYGTPTINGSPDGEVAVASLQLSDQTTALIPNINLGTNLIRAEYDRQNTGGAVPQVNGAYLRFDNFSNTAQTQQISGTKVLFINVGGAGGNSQQNIFHNMQFPSPRFGVLNVGLYAATPGTFTPTSGSDWLIRNDIPNLQSAINGALWLPSWNNSSMATMSIVAPVSLSSSLKVVQATAPPAPSVVCSGGASTYTYILVGVDSNGGVVAGSGNTCNTGTNPLTVGNPATVSINANTMANQLLLEQFSRIDIYRTGGPMATGKVGSLTCNGGVPASTTTCTAFSDTGIAPTGTAPTVNNTGALATAYGFTDTNTCTSSASPAVCANATVGFVAVAAGSATLTVNTTAVSATSRILIQPDASLGTALGVTCNATQNPIGISARVASTSFTMSTTAPAANPECASFLIVNPN